MATSEADIAAKLIERLLGDPAFRSEFRRDPASACRKAGLDELADEMSMGAGKAMMTLDQRESKSSLAGVMMAAAMEGVGIYQFGENVLPHLDDVPSAVGDVLSRVSLPAIDLKGALAGGPDAPAAAPPAEDAAANGAAEAGAPAGGAAAAAAPAAAPPEDAAANGKGEAKEAGEPEEKVLPPELAPAEEAAAKIAAAESPEAKNAAAAEEAVAKIKEEAKDLPDANDLPDSGVAPQEVEEVGPGGKAVPEEHDHAEHDHDHGAEAAPATPAPPAAVETPGQPAAPAAVETAAGGGGGDAAEALLQNKNLVLDADAQKDIRDGAVDPRMISLLGQLTEKHKIELSVIKTGHGQFTSGGSVSNHFVGRGIDIARVDGEIVNPGSLAARELATEIAAMTGDLRPTEVGTPWAIGASGFFTDGGHQDHLHVAFDGEPPPGFKAAAASPAPVAPAPAGAVAAAAPSQPAAAAAAAPERKPGDSMTFRAVTAEEATASAKPKKGDSLAFMKAVEPQPAAPAAAAAVEPGSAGVPADLSGVPDAYPGDDAPQPEIAAWMAKQAEARGLPPELPIMAALVESGMKNLNFGHADSVGFFQMRVGIWNQGDYAGYPEKPELQVKWFLDEAEKAKDARVAAGKPIDDPSSYGEWVADTERPAEQYRYKYQTKLEEARRLLEQAPQGQAPAAVAPPAAVETPGQPAPPAAVETPGGGSEKIDPSQFGGEGSGGTPSAETLALLKNDKITFDETGISDLKAGKIDPRVVAVLTKLSEDHELTISCMCSDHSKMTAGGSISNHFHGRGVDIASVDGQIVNPGSTAARELATEMQEIAADYRPDEIGTPWAISGPGYFTDAGHQDHLHLGFKTEIDPNWKPPADVAAGGQPAAAPAAAGAVASAVPGQPAAAAAAAPPERKIGDSMTFRAVSPEAAAADAAAKPKKGDSMSFIAVQPPAGPASAVAAPGTVPAAVADAATATAAGSSSLGAAALEVAKGELAKGVREEGVNTGAAVDQYLAAAGVAPGNPWCAGFVTWSLEQSGHKMEGGGWAAVQTWVRAAEARTNDLQIVSAEDARPGDLVTYDWGGQEDFAADGHIGFLASNVEGGKFTALEGNNQDRVMTVPRATDQANVKFIRIGGDAPPAAAAPPVAPAAAGTPAPPAAVEPSGGGAADVAAAATDAGGANKYPGDDAPREQIAAWMAKEAEARGLPPQLPVMASLVESGLKNLDHGHADSVGFYQMRTGIWDQGEYAGYPDKPELQVKWFLDHAEEVKKQRVAAGLPVDDPSQFGEWIADVERPAEEYRGRYQLQLDEANSLLGTTSSAPPAAASAAEEAGAAAAAAPDPPKARRGETMQFMAVEAKEAVAAARKRGATVQFMKAIDPKQATAAAAPPGGAATPAVAAAAATGPTAAEDAAMNQAVGAPVPAAELALQEVGPIGTYPGDQASQAELAKWLASEAKKAGLPPELPVMASLVESGVKNLKGGDADSAGFFQMRVGIWDSGPYKGYRTDPQLQAKWFIDNALAVKKQRLAAGKSVTDPSSFGEWIADVERPAAQYRYKYQLQLGEARKLLR